MPASTAGNTRSGHGSSRSIPATPMDARKPTAPQPQQAAPPATAQSTPPPVQQDSQTMNDVLRQLFNR